MSCIIPQRVINPRYRKIVKINDRTKYDAIVELGIDNLLRDLRSGISLSDSEYSSFASYIFNDNIDNYIDREDFFIDVPCGRCINCLKSRSSSWAIRLYYEYEYMSSEQRQNSYFVTLTIKPEYYEKIKSNPSKFIRLFLDRCRKRGGQSVKHFIQNDFGENTLRLHFHAILFDVPFDIAELETLWKYGYVNSSQLNMNRIFYTAAYTTKSVEELVSDPDFRPLTFASPGLGKSYASDDYNQRFHRRDGQPIPILLNFSGNMQAMPRYLREKIFSPEELEELQQCYYANLSDDVIPDPPYRIGKKQYDDYTLYFEDAKKVLAMYQEKYKRKIYNAFNEVNSYEL